MTDYPIDEPMDAAVANLNPLPLAEDLLELQRAKTVETLAKLASASKLAPVAHSRLMARAIHPWACRLARQALEGRASAGLVAKTFRALDAVSDRDIKFLLEGRILVRQDPSLVAEDQERHLVMEPVHEDQDELQRRLQAHIACAASILGPSWERFISPIKTVSFVSVQGVRGIPFFSGSNNDLFGAIICSPQDEAWITAEVLTHEAAHMWLSLMEDDEELATEGWTGEAYYSPWREDLRPIAGLIHGVYVFTSVANVLAIWINRGQAPEALIKRLAFVIEQVLEGVIVVRDSGRASDRVLDLCDSSEALLYSLSPLIPVQIRTEARKRLDRANGPSH